MQGRGFRKTIGTVLRSICGCRFRFSRRVSYVSGSATNFDLRQLLCLRPRGLYHGEHGDPPLFYEPVRTHDLARGRRKRGPAQLSRNSTGRQRQLGAAGNRGLGTIRRRPGRASAALGAAGNRGLGTIKSRIFVFPLTLARCMPDEKIWPGPLLPDAAVPVARQRDELPDAVGLDLLGDSDRALQDHRPPPACGVVKTWTPRPEPVLDMVGSKENYLGNGWEAGIRTPISRSRVCRVTVTPPPIRPT